MSQLEPESAAPSEQLLADAWKSLHKLFFALFLVSFVLVWLNAVLSFTLPGQPGWPYALLLITAAFTSVIALMQKLPAQNVLLAAVIIAVIAGVIQAIGALTKVPFGPYVFTRAAGPKIFGVLPWCVPLWWIVFIFTGRGVARLILRPWRKSRTYGFRVIGLTTALVLILDLGLEPFATVAKRFWLWEPTKLNVLWHGTPISNFLGWLLTTLIALAFATPVLMNKRHRKTPTDYHPLVVWTLLNVLFLSAAVAEQLWTAAGFIVVSVVTTLVFAIRGARW